MKRMNKNFPKTFGTHRLLLATAFAVFFTLDVRVSAETYYDGGTLPEVVILGSAKAADTPAQYPVIIMVTDPSTMAPINKADAEKQTPQLVPGYTSSTTAAGPRTNGCDNDDNERINPVLALCSVHAYNIGAEKNPDNAALRQEMNEVVALKTTVMTQQMKKQYDYLDVTIKRFKTQLEKAVLVSKLQAAGAPGGAADGYSTGGGGATAQAMGDDCTGKNRTDTVYCLRQNYSKMRAAADGKNFSSELKDQIVKDSNALYYMDSSLMAKSGEGSECRIKTNLNQSVISSCLGLIGGAITRLEEGGKKQQQTYNPYAMGVAQ